STGSIAWTLLAIGRPSPFSGAFGLVGFWIGLAMWLGHAWFGTVALRTGALPRLAVLMLAVGSILALLGMDRLALTSSASPTIFGPI
ncbi:MAG TPA: hypothetical protein VES19_02750, partial [Candidatus Limnocylindrales bacterium]|nr:hypothetical protein [Candidatus Limnocylindrales bacterium]